MIVYDAYRPLRASRAMVDWARRTGRTWLFTQGYIAYPSNHNRGTTIDLALVRRRDGHRLEMGTAYDSASRRAWTYNASGRILSRRLTLVRAMAAEGFRNYRQEWWHFDSVRRGPSVLDTPIGCGR